LPYLRVLADEAISSTQMEYYEKQPIAYALGNLRDGSSVDRLAKLAETSQYYARTEALFALALIGTEEAGERLVQMMVDCKDDRASTDVGRALIEHGGDICMSAVLDCAGRRSDGPKWLVECIDQAFMARGRSHRGFYPLKNDAAIIDYIQANEQILEGSEIERLIWAFRWIDSGNSRRLLREWAARRGSQKVLPAGKRGGDLSALAYEALIDRGDAFSVSEFISWKLAVPRNACSRTL